MQMNIEQIEKQIAELAADNQALMETVHGLQEIVQTQQESIDDILTITESFKKHVECIKGHDKAIDELADCNNQAQEQISKITKLFDDLLDVVNEIVDKVYNRHTTTIDEETTEEDETTDADNI